MLLAELVDMLDEFVRVYGGKDPGVNDNDIEAI